MRPKERIKEILKIIELIWEDNPDLRLGQLLANTVMSSEDIYYVEDGDLIKRIQKIYKRNESKS